MATRYDSLKISKIDKGQGFKFSTPEELNDGGFESSLGVDVDDQTGLLKTAKKLIARSFFDSGNFSTFPRLHCLQSDQEFVLMYHSAHTRIELWSATIFGAFSVVYQFPLTTTYPYCLISYKGLLIAFYLDGAQKKVAYSSNAGASWTISNWAYGIIDNYCIGENGELYLTGSNHNQVFSTSDGITYTLYQTLGTYEYIRSCAYAEGYLYILVTSSRDHLSKLCRVENDAVLTVLTLPGEPLSWGSDICSFNNALYVLLTDPSGVYASSITRLYRWDKKGLIPITVMSGGSLYCKFLTNDDKSLFFSIGDVNIYKMTRDEAVFYYFDGYSSGIESFFSGSMYRGRLLLPYMDFDSMAAKIYHDPPAGSGEVWQSPVTFVSSTYLLGEHVPSYLIVRHRPLVAGSSIVIKAKTNWASTFAYTLGTINTVGLTKTTIQLKTILTSKIDLIQFEVTITDTTNAGNVKDLILEYLYVPVGLPASK